MTDPNPHGINDSTSHGATAAGSPWSCATCGQPKRSSNPACSGGHHAHSLQSADGHPPGRKITSIRDMSLSRVPSVRSLPGGDLRNRHRGTNPYYPPHPSQGQARLVAREEEEPARELPMHYSFPVRTPVAGKYVAPPPWYTGISTWAWWRPAIVYWGTCQGCCEDQGCCAEDGCCEACDWRCCLSCWCPWWFGGPNHRFLGWY